MPEAAEVAHITDQLYKMHFLKDLWLHDMTILGGRYERHGPPEDWGIFKANLPLHWIDVQCKGKFIYFTFQNRYKDKFFLWNTLAMTGSWTTAKEKHSHIEFVFKKSNEKKVLFFNDIRCFGTMHVCFDEKAMNEKLKSIGQSWLGKFYGDPRTINVTEEYFLEVLKKHENTNVCKFLMNQSILSGIGNYLLSEVLYHSKTYPWSKIKDLNDNNRKELYNSIATVVEHSYNLDGVSLQDYHGVDGEIGEYQNLLQVYQQEKDPKGNDVVKEEGPHGRSLHWVPNVQCNASF